MVLNGSFFQVSESLEQSHGYDSISKAECF